MSEQSDGETSNQGLSTSNQRQYQDISLIIQPSTIRAAWHTLASSRQKKMDSMIFLETDTDLELSSSSLSMARSSSCDPNCNHLKLLCNSNISQEHRKYRDFREMLGWIRSEDMDAPMVVSECKQSTNIIPYRHMTNILFKKMILDSIPNPETETKFTSKNQHVSSIPLMNELKEKRNFTSVKALSFKELLGWIRHTTEDGIIIN
jgi:hypothetical protein